MQLTRAKRAKWSLVGVLGGATVIVACSSASSISEVGGGFAGSGGVVGGSASGPTTGASSGPPRCPNDPPPAGSLCSDSAPYCTFGPDLRDDCVDEYGCVKGRWAETTGSCAVRCPKTFEEIAPGATCGDIDMACSYDEGTCGCMGERPSKDAGLDADADAGADPDAGDAAPSKPLYPGVWKCVAPPTTVACPSARPRLLDECVKPVTCDYGTCELGRPLSYDCTVGAWRESFDPPSCDR